MIRLSHHCGGRNAIRQRIPTALARLALAGALIGLAGCGMLRTATPDAAPTTLSQLQADADHVSIEAAEAKLAAGRDTEAQDDFTRLLAGDPTDARARIGLAESLLAGGDYANAMAVFRSLPADAGYRDRILQGEGTALLQLGQADAGGALLLQSVRGDPNQWRSWNGIGQYYDGKQQWASAASAYERALELSRGAPIVLNNQGMSLLLQQRFGDAAGKFATALKLDPHLATARTNLRLALAWQGRYDEAAAGASQNELGDVLNNVGYVAMMRRDYDQAQSYLVRATEASPTYNKLAWDNLKKLEQLSGRPVQ